MPRHVPPVTRTLSAAREDTQSPDESALVVMVPEAAHLVSGLRRLYDPAASLGVGAHVTVLYPWIPPEEITSADLLTIRELAASIDPFKAQLERVAWFPGDVMYLVPEPGRLFELLLKSFHDAYPQHPPYEGRYPKVVPHLTVSESRPRIELQETERQLARQLSLIFPVAEVTLIRVLHSQQRSETMHRIALGDNLPRLRDRLL